MIVRTYTYHTTTTQMMNPNVPVKACGLASEFLERYAIGYFIMTVNNIFIMPEANQGWCTLFYVSAGLLSMFAATIRAILPHSE
jgi:hypothetical protein